MGFDVTPTLDWERVLNRLRKDDDAQVMLVGCRFTEFDIFIPCGRFCFWDSESHPVPEVDPTKVVGMVMIGIHGLPIWKWMCQEWAPRHSLVPVFMIESVQTVYVGLRHLVFRLLGEEIPIGATVESQNGMYLPGRAKTGFECSLDELQSIFDQL